MPAAQPTKSSVSNVICAIVAAGLQPGAVRVNVDGSFTVDVAGNLNAAPSEEDVTSGQTEESADEAIPWGMAV